MGSYSIDPVLIAEFIDESTESLSELDHKFIQLKESPSDLTIVTEIFRPIHSMKGNAAFFGLMKTKVLTHRMENLLDNIRKEKQVATPEVIEALLTGVDHLKEILLRVREQEDELDDEQSYGKLIQHIEDLSSQGDKTDTPIQQVLSILNDLLTMELQTEAQGKIHEAKNILASQQPLTSESENTTAPSCKSSDNTTLPLEIQEIEDILSEPIQSTLEESLIVKVTTNFEQMLNRAQEESVKNTLSVTLDEINTFLLTVGFDNLLREMIFDRLKELKDNSQLTAALNKTSEPKSSQELVQQEVLQKDDEKEPKDTPKKGTQVDKTMRVSESKIDSFLAYVGEFIVVEEMFNFIKKELSSENISRETTIGFTRILDIFSELSEKLRSSILDIRMVPIKTLLQKVPRLAHDTAKQAQKDAEVIVEGENIKIDKSYIDLLDAPITHIIRNSIDHGIESPSQREAVGKPIKGKVIVSVIENSDELKVVISDDGAGINQEKILQKAVEKGIIDSNHNRLSSDDIIDFLFAPGISTAEKVTDISGRGVGMDVVKTNIESAGGHIEVDSENGKGSTFSIILPKTVSTQIIDGFLVKCFNEIYVLPMELIGESFSPLSEDISTMVGKDEVVSRRGELIPLIRLQQVLDYHSENNNLLTPPAFISTINISQKKYALAVDEIIGVQKVVVKPVKGLPTSKPIFDGAAMMGDGKVAMLIGNEGLKTIIHNTVSNMDS